MNVRQQQQTERQEIIHQPNTKRFFSGSRFPVAALSSMDDQIFVFFFGPSLLDSRLLPPMEYLEEEFRFDVDMLGTFSMSLNHS